MKLPIALLAGGLATRLRPVTETIPKALLEIHRRPFIDHQLELLASCGARRVVLCLWHHGELIRQHIGSGNRFGLEVEYSFDGDSPLGTGGALKKALPQLGEAFLVLYGDSYLPCDYAAVEASFLGSGKEGLMTVYRNQNEGDRSNVVFSGGRIHAYDKRQQLPNMEYIDYGLGGLRPAALEGIPAGQACDLADLYRQLLARDQLAGLEVTQRFYEVGSFEGIEAFKHYLLTQGEIKHG